MKHFELMFVLSSFAAACGGTEGSSAHGVRQPESLAARSSALVSDNGRSLNGRSLNGGTLNGRSLNGVLLNGVSTGGVQLNGIGVALVSVNGSILSGLLGGVSITGSNFVGSTWDGVLSDGTTLPLRIDAARRLPEPNADLLGYALAYPSDDGWQPLCGIERDGTPVLAIPMAGLWDYGQNVEGAGSYDPNAPGITFACRHDAIAKCVELGYRPWSGALLPYTVACTRMLRADYCGTGVSYTVDGTLVDVYDRLSIQTITQTDWPIDAEWGPNGARCMASESLSRFPNSGAVPPCYARLSRTGCGTSFKGGPGVLLIDRYLKVMP